MSTRPSASPQASPGGRARHGRASLRSAVLGRRQAHRGRRLYQRRSFWAAVSLAVVGGSVVAINTASAETVDTNAWYVLVNQNTGDTLDDLGYATNDGASVVQWSRNGGTNQQWRFIDAGDGNYRLQNRNSGKVLDDYNWSKTEGSELVQWRDAQDTQHGRVVVLSKETNEKLFGGQNSVGKTVRMNEIDYNVVGVLGEWKPRIKYYDLTNGTLNDPEEFYLPYTTVIENKTNSTGNNNCWKDSDPGWDGYLASECIWQQFWVQLDSPARAAEYSSFLANYVEEQKKLGRFPRPLNNRLDNVREFLDHQKVVPKDVEVQVGLSFAFLLVCLINTIGLLLAKFMRKTGEIGLRRALGASKPQLFAQHIIESSVIGISGGVFGLLLTFGGLVLVRVLYKDYANVAHLDWAMVAMTVVLSTLAAVLAGLYPTWRACQIAPAAQLKTQ